MRGKKILDECGYKITNLENGPMRVLIPRSSMLQVEGPAGAAKIAWNLATHKDLRERVVSTKAVIESHTDRLGYIHCLACHQETMIMKEYAWSCNRPGFE
jgi:hypothetical protein